MTIIGDVLIAVLAIGVTLYFVRPYQRVSSNPLMTLSFRTLAFFAIAGVTFVPSVMYLLADVSHIPMIATWITNMFSLLSAYSCLGFFLHLSKGEDYSERYFRRVRFWLAGTMAVMTIMAFTIGDQATPEGLSHHGVHLLLIIYRLPYCGFLFYVVGHLFTLWGRQFRASRDIGIRRGMMLFMVGAVSGWIWLALNVPLVLVDGVSQQAEVLQSVMSVTFVSMAGCFMIGAIGAITAFRGTMLGGPLRTMIAYRRLQPLWRDLTSAAPQVVLPLHFPLAMVLWQPDRLDLLLYRRVVEVLDAWRVLADEKGNPLEVAATALTNQWTMHALHDAKETRLLLQSPSESGKAGLPTFRSADYIENVRYLELVARFYVQRD